ncbi:hypothetical protein AMTRI_Chr11g157490 [Amborella trichopoda]|uniref:uncharacterized protein LOC18448321 n=1 Tax=Amborella trichopoda TaxID=13333 RepID=UPI0005D3DCCA|nr:uncharacterized protein LOC18448321 [Amborella trichopoda]|eukprot:XP_011628564.1 uncharacterized protein LOC18448321 [Amborella trichopoda]
MALATGLLLRTLSTPPLKTLTLSPFLSLKEPLYSATRHYSSYFRLSPRLDLCFRERSERRTGRGSSFVLVRAARAESVGVSMGFRAPEFELPEPLTGKVWKLADFESYPALLVMFICNHCPFVIHLKKDIVKLTNFYMQKGLAVVAISANSVLGYPQDGPEFMAEDAKQYNYSFPYLYDESQEVARAFGAKCTPEFFLFKKDGRRPFELVYHGQFDDSRPSHKIPVTGRDLSQAIDCVLSGQPVPAEQKPSIGCSIKWHPAKSL